MQVLWLMLIILKNSFIKCSFEILRINLRSRKIRDQGVTIKGTECLILSRVSLF
jgi:hypothetical protein